MRPSRGTRWWLAAVAALSCVGGAAAAAVCTETTGQPAPSAITFMASTKDPVGTAWLLYPNCSFKTFTTTTLSLVNTGIDRIESVPSGLSEVTSVFNPLAQGADFSAARELNTLYISYFDPAMAKGLVLPAALSRLDLDRSPLTSIDGITFPADLPYLFLDGNRLTRVEAPKLPKNLRKLSIRNDTFSLLSRVEFGDSITWLDFSNSSISTIKGVTWPRSLDILNLNQNFITEFEIRQSDVPLFANLTGFLGSWSLAGCSTAGAELTVVKAVNPNAQQWTRQQICVISDARFKELYGTQESSSSGSGSGSSSDAVTVPTPRATIPVQEPAVEATRKTLVIVVASGGGFVFLVLLPLFFYRVRLQKKKTSRHAADKLGTAYTATTTDDDHNDGSDPPLAPVAPAEESEEYLPNDVRNDPTLIPHRIDRQDLHVGDVIARGGFGVIFHGRFDGQHVAVKQMLPGTWQNATALSRFMEEIHLCARLDHPKIVAFVGLAWSRLRDLSVVIEFMAGGDLHAFLHRQSAPPSSRDWRGPWTSAGLSHSKTAIALDVAEAVVYLHSLQTPVIHRDLKARNVLLDGDGNAKLSDFGISREVAIDETMTGEIGTVAWIAPEVLRGERYSEKADVYSLGVLLVELDCCRHPYAGHAALKGPRASHVESSGSGKAVNQNTRIAVLVSTGKLQPRVGDECPEAVATLVSQCVSHEPSERPTAMEVFYQLRQARKALVRRQGTLV